MPPCRLLRPSHRLGAVLVAAAALITFAAPPVLAHPEDGVAATNFRARVTAVTPDPGVVRVGVGGGDSWLTVEVDPGHEVVVLGYDRPGQDKEPYLRIDPDGSVHVNGNSPATWLNDDRYGQIDIPAWVDPTAEPRWQVIAVAGTHLAEWHEHRIHWMSPEPPGQVRADPGREHRIFEWEVPLVVDGEPVVVQGVLDWLPSRSSIPPVLVGVVALAAAFLTTRGGRTRTGALAVAAAGAVGTAIGAGAYLHPEGPPSWTGIVLPAVGLACGLLGAIRPRLGAGAIVVGTIAVAAWALPALPTVTRPLIFNLVPGLAVWLLVPAAIGLAVGAAAAVYADPPDRTEATDAPPIEEPAS